MRSHADISHKQTRARRGLLMVVVAVVTAVCLPSAPALAASSTTKKPAKHAPKKPKLPVNAERAQLAFEAMQKTYYIDGSGLYQGEPFSFLWPFSQALAATMSMANIPSLKSVFAHEVYARLGGLKSYL